MEYKNQAIDLTDLALGIIVLGIVVTIGATMLTTYKDARLTDMSQVTVANETTFLNSTQDTLSTGWVKDVSACWNTTAAAKVLLPAGNYTATISLVDGKATVVNATNLEYPDATCTYTYYNTSRADYALADDAATGIAEYGNWFKIIVIVGVAAVVLSLIFMAFGNRGQGQSTGVSY